MSSEATSANSIIIRNFGITDYLEVWHNMQQFTKLRTSSSYDELWQLEHQAVFTLGQAGLAKHILNSQNIPIIYTDRGGQVTYHGPGQLIIYLLLDLRRKNLTLKQVLFSLQQAVVDLLASYGVIATLDKAHPGVYVDKAKISAIGLKVKKGCLYHGLSLNVAMDLQPFTYINPCGRENLAITQTSALGIKDDITILAKALQNNLLNYLGYFPSLP